MSHQQTEEAIELTQTLGLLQAEIIAGRLRSAGIPVWIWQEGAGKAHGLIVGSLGVGHVMVPKSQLQEAAEILLESLDLVQADEAANQPEGIIEEEVTREISPFSKMILLFLALGQNRIITIIFLILALVFRFLSREQADLVECPYCGSEVELIDTEIETGEYDCPFCDSKVFMAAHD
jgi:DNA-directed RNA polymerase subunit RPC12/RpoP